MRSLRFLTLLAVMASATLPIACASSGSTTISEDAYPWGMRAFSSAKPPKCPYEEVGRLTWEGGERVWGADFEERAKIEQARNDRAQQLLDAYYELEADAFIEPRGRGGVTEFSFIRFTEADCRE